MPESYTGTEGTAAAAAGMDVLDGTEQDRNGWLAINKTRDYIVAKINALWPVSILRGGTGATTAAVARTNLAAVGTADVAIADAATPNKIPRYNGAGQLTTDTPTLGGHAASKEYVDARVGGSSSADGPTSAAYARNAVGSGWFVVYMNSALQFMRNTSSRRYKKNIRNWSGSVLDLRTVIFDRRGNDTPNDEVGFIAEEVEAVLPEAAMYFDGKIDGINDRAILAAAVADLQRLARRITELEESA